ncbi:MAG: LPXTG cell wall anchor domain-containing protein, partial [Acidimicrobiales bacterium]
MRTRLLTPLAAALLVACAVLALVSPAGAVENPDYTAPPPSTVVTPAPPSGTDPPASQPVRNVSTAVAVRPVRTQLAITGSDVTQTAAIGAALLAVGAVLLVVRRRAPAA